MTNIKLCTNYSRCLACPQKHLQIIKSGASMNYQNEYHTTLNRTKCTSVNEDWISLCRTYFTDQILNSKMKFLYTRCTCCPFTVTHLKASQLSNEASSRLWQHVAKSVTWFRNPGSAGSASLHYMNLGGPVWYGPRPMCPGEGRWCAYGGGGPGPPRYRW
jgi:hypothetical protein